MSEWRRHAEEQARRARQTKDQGNGQTRPEPTPVLPLLYDARTFVGEDEPDENDESPEDWIIPGLVPRAGVTFLAGLPKLGKTWLAVDLGIATSTGQPFLGHRTYKSRVFALLEEDPKRRIRARMWRLARGRGLDPRDLDGLRLNAMIGFRIDSPEMIARLKAEIEAHHPDLIVIDALARVHGADENDRTAMRAALSELLGVEGPKMPYLPTQDTSEEEWLKY